MLFTIFRKDSRSSHQYVIQDGHSAPITTNEIIAEQQRRVAEAKSLLQAQIMRFAHEKAQEEGSNMAIGPGPSAIAKNQSKPVQGLTAIRSQAHRIDPSQGPPPLSPTNQNMQYRGRVAELLLQRSASSSQNEPSMRSESEWDSDRSFAESESVRTPLGPQSVQAQAGVAQNPEDEWEEEQSYTDDGDSGPEARRSEASEAPPFMDSNGPRGPNVDPLSRRRWDAQQHPQRVKLGASAAANDAERSRGAQGAVETHLTIERSLNEVRRAAPRRARGGMRSGAEDALLSKCSRIGRAAAADALAGGSADGGHADPGGWGGGLPAVPRRGYQPRPRRLPAARAGVLP